MLFIVVVVAVVVVLSGQTDRSTSSKILAWSSSCNIHSQHTRKGEDRKDGGEA